MQTLIAGGGEIGFKIASYLAEHGESVTIIDENKSRCDFLSKNADARVYKGSVLDPALLMEAGIDKADMLVTALGNDEITVKLVDFAKSQFGIPRVIAVTDSSGTTLRVRESGADRVVCSEEVVLDEIEGMFRAGGNVTVYKDRSRNCMITRSQIKATSRTLGKKVSQLPLRNSRIAVLLRGDKTIFPSEDTELQMGDELFLVGSEESVEKMIEEIEGS